MCSTPKIPQVDTTVQDPVAAPTIADASVEKAASNTRNQQAALSNRNVKSTALGVLDEAETKKKILLGE